MNTHLAQINIASFRKPVDHPDNKDFVDNLDRINGLAESQPGFKWRWITGNNHALEARVFDDPNIIVNMSVWNSIESLSAFAYRNLEHRALLRRRSEWFDELEFHLALWWVPEGHIPSIEEAKEKLALLAKSGSTQAAFTFKQAFDPPAV